MSRDDGMDDEMVMRVVDARSVKAYLKAGGCRCLYCGYEGVEGESVDVEQGGATQKVSCPRCGGAWHDLHRLVGALGEDGSDLLARRRRR
jgi:hypothetical protein